MFERRGAAAQFAGYQTLAELLAAPSVVLASGENNRAKLGLCRSQTFELVGMPRGGVPARSGAEGGTNFVKRMLLVIRFRRLTLRSATGTAQRAVPTNFSTSVCERHNPELNIKPMAELYQ